MAATPFLALATLGYASAAGASAEDIARILLVVGSFLVTGLVAWANRPANRMGRLMVALALSLLLSMLAQPVWPLVVPIGLAFFVLASTLLGYLILAYPSGELRTPANQALVLATAVLLGGPRLVRLLTQDPAGSGLGYDNPYLLIRDPGFATTMATLPYYFDIVVLVAFVAFVASRWLGASGPTRRALSPVLIPTMGLLLILVGDAVSIVTDVPPSVRGTFDDAQLLARAALPIGFVIGLLRTRVARAAIADLVVELGATPTPARLREALAHALGDPTLTVGYWSASTETFIDSDGRPIDPSDRETGAVTVLERDGVPIAVIVHDPTLLDDPGLVASVASAVRLAVENERLSGEVEAQLLEVRASRARIVEAGDTERRRVERDLHDGAQQRLVALTLALRLARTRLGEAGDPDVRLSLDQASDEAKAALSELRELARGLHPQILTQAGLAAALTSLADRSPIEVSLDVGDGRYAANVEGAAYFVVSEALANVAKYANASHVSVRTDWRLGELMVEVADDGAGGADPGRGSGLRGLADRLAALNGTLEVISPKDGGTRLLARIPTVGPTPTLG